MASLNDSIPKDSSVFASMDQKESGSSTSVVGEKFGNALTMSWVLGVNKDLLCGVHNLSCPADGANDAVTEIFFVAAHTGVIQDYSTGCQKLLQGHVNPITATAVSNDRQWIITADTGPESMLVVWSRLSCSPARIIFRPHPNGVRALDFSPDGKYFVSLSSPVAGNEGGESQLSLIHI